MAVQRYISSSFWSDDWVDSLNVKEKLVYVYLLTNDSTSICGVYKLTVKRIKDDTGISRQEITDILQKFAADKKAYYVDEYIILPNWLKHQHLNNESVRLGTIRALKALPDHIIAFLREPHHFYYDVDTFLGIKKKEVQPATEDKNTDKNNAGNTRSSDIPAQKTIMQNNTSTPDLHCQQEAVPPEVGGVPTQYPLIPSKSAHDLDFDLDLKRDSLNSLDISTHLERGGVCENQQTADKPPAPEEPAQPSLKKIQHEKKSSRFIKPTVEEIAAYCRSISSIVDPNAFFNFYESKDWYVGKNKMKNWKAAIRTWEIKERQQHSRSPPANSAPNYKQQNFNETALPEIFKQSRLADADNTEIDLEGVAF